jgi:serine/threonine protein kinase
MGRREEAARSLAAAARLDARFGPYYDKFLTLPADADANLFFSSELEPAPQSEEGAFRLSGKARTMAIIVGSSLSGGFLVALGLISLSAPARERIKTLVRTSPGRRDAAPDAAPPADGPVSLAATRLQEEGSEVGAFLLRRQIGAGGMGVVYEAFDRNLERRVAIKKLREDASGDPRAAERVLHEARTVAALRHPNIVEIYSVVAEGADIQLVFEFVDGHTLQELMRGRRRLPYDWSLGVMEAVAGALDYAHGRGVIHRDLKPSNVMIDKEGSVKVMDFGIAQADRTSGRRMTGSGTPLYMAPEHERGEARRESDVYSMGVTLYEMVTGRLPFSGTPSGISLSKLNASYVPPSQVNPDLPSNFDRVLAFALAPDPAKRWRTPSEFVRNLQALGPAPSRTPRPG